jgi:hypothetical protein
VFSPDLLFGSNVLGTVQAAGYEGALCSDGDALRAELPRSRALIADLTADVPLRLELLGRLRADDLLNGVATLACYSHVDTEARMLAEQADLDLVVPRSRLAREGAALLERVLETAA